MDKIVYKCKNCGWTKQIIALWEDSRPVFCPNKKCELSKEKSKGKKSFRKHPDLLQVTKPHKKPTVTEEKPPKKKPKRVEPKKKEEKVVNEQRKPKEVKS